MSVYKVWVCLEATFNDIEADSEAEAVDAASDRAMNEWDCRYTCEKIEAEGKDNG